MRELEELERELTLRTEQVENGYQRIFNLEERVYELEDGISNTKRSLRLKLRGPHATSEAISFLLGVEKKKK